MAYRYELKATWRYRYELKTTRRYRYALKVTLRYQLTKKGAIYVATLNVSNNHNYVHGQRLKRYWPVSNPLGREPPTVLTAYPCRRRALKSFTTVIFQSTSSTYCMSACMCSRRKLQALVYNILPSTTAVFIITPEGPENCQLTSSFLLVLRQ